MKAVRIWILVGLGTSLAIFGAVFIDTPGYLDADYYFATGREIALGNGFTEPFIWTYITDPAGVPTPSHLYWMPLTSLVSGASMAVLGWSFTAGQLPFLILFALLPLAVAHLSFRLHADADDAFRSGLLAAFPGFFLPYFLTTDMFILYAWIGIGIFALLVADHQRMPWLGFGLGLLVGLAHLARADGLLLAVPALVGILTEGKKRQHDLILLLVGYVFIMGPWFFRNFSVIGLPLSPGTSRTLWLSSYPDLFRYPPDMINKGTWLDSGLGHAFQVRAEAFFVNLERILAENGLIFLGPFMLLGGLKLRSQLAIKAAFYYGLLLFIVMTLIFPFAGTHGGVFHSSAALMPLLWCLAPIGLDQAIGLAASRRGWEPDRAKTLFKNTAVIFAGILTLGLAAGRVVGADPHEPRWNEPQADYQALVEVFPASASQFPITVVNNPPGFFLATGRSAIVLPEGGIENLKEVVQRFGAGWVVIDRNTTEGLRPLYEGAYLPSWLTWYGQIEDSNGNPIIVFLVDQDALK